jgi:hypothetical protein
VSLIRAATSFGKMSRYLQLTTVKCEASSDLTTKVNCFCADDRDEEVPWLITEYVINGDLWMYVRNFGGTMKYVS